MPDHSPTVKELLAALQRASRSWMNGSSKEYADMMAHTDDFTIAGPFGGPTLRGWSERSRTAQAQTASQFKGGTADIELAASYESGDLLVLVMTERCEVEFDGYDGPQPWILRSTQVYRREGGKWLVVHRHADPLIQMRSLKETIELVSKREHY